MLPPARCSGRQAGAGPVAESGRASSARHRDRDQGPESSTATAVAPMAKAVVPMAVRALPLATRWRSATTPPGETSSARFSQPARASKGRPVTNRRLDSADAMTVSGTSELCAGFSAIVAAALNAVPDGICPARISCRSRLAAIRCSGQQNFRGVGSFGNDSTGWSQPGSWQRRACADTMALLLSTPIPSRPGVVPPPGKAPDRRHWAGPSGGQPAEGVLVGRWPLSRTTSLTTRNTVEVAVTRRQLVLRVPPGGAGPRGHGPTLFEQVRKGTSRH